MRLKWLAFGFVAALLLPTSPAAAGDIYDPSRILAHHANECVAVANCITIQSKVYRVKGGGTRQIAESCPESHPIVAGWHTRQHEHLHARLGGIAHGTLTVRVSNLFDEPGRIKIFVGCTDELLEDPGLMTSRTGIPSNRLRANRGQADD